MSIRTWSLTRFWSVTALTWIAAVVVAGAADNSAGAHLAALALAFVPAFVAGAWAGSHAEIREWPLTRVIAMWLFAGIALTAAGDALRDGRFVAIVVLAPVAILTVRWVEMLGQKRSTTPVPVATPSSGTPIP